MVLDSGRFQENRAAVPRKFVRMKITIANEGDDQKFGEDMNWPAGSCATNRGLCVRWPMLLRPATSRYELAHYRDFNQPWARPAGKGRWAFKGQMMAKKTLKKYVFDAGNSNTGVAGLVIAVRAHGRRAAVGLANDFLRKYKYKPIEIEADKSGADAGVAWALFCVGPNLTKRDIDEEEALSHAPSPK